MQKENSGLLRLSHIINDETIPALIPVSHFKCLASVKVKDFLKPLNLGKIITCREASDISLPVYRGNKKEGEK
jgi:hypothetical protein